MSLFETSDRAKKYQEDLVDFMEGHVYPAEPVYEEQMRQSGDPHFHPPILEELKAEARRRGLWNLFHPHPGRGPGLSNFEYAPLAEIMGRSPHLAPEATNCAAPDTGNMEVLTLFGTDEHKVKYLEPLLDGKIRSAFAMTEPDVASSDATNIELRMERDGDGYILNGRKWFASNALHKNCKVLIVMGKTDPAAASHRQQSMMVVPIDAPGVTLVRGLPVFGYQDREGHAEILFEDVRVPERDVLAGEGEGFAISQARLGPGRIHHCMRTIGMAERALELLCRRALSRRTFGLPLAERANIQDWIAEARIDIEKSRLLTLKAAWMMDEAGNKAARTEIAAIKVDAPTMALQVVDRAIQVHGGGGVTDDFPLASFWAHLRTLRLADGPDEVHKRTIARQELRKYADAGETTASARAAQPVVAR
jgi:acyl-CoA dehydrogenase